MDEDGGIAPIGDVSSGGGSGVTEIGAGSATSAAGAADLAAPADPSPAPPAEPTDRVDANPNAPTEEAQGAGHDGVDALASGLKGGGEGPHDPEPPGLSTTDRAAGPDRNDPKDPANAERLDQIGNALQNGGQFTYKNAAGQETPVSVTPSETHRTNGSAYDVRVPNAQGGQDFVHVETDKGQDPKQVIDRTLNAYTQLPQDVRHYASRVNVYDGPNPQDEHWRNTPGYAPDHVSAATGGSNNINIYNGVENLTPEIFNHEVGHSVGQAHGQDVTRDDGLQQRLKFPEGWGQAADGDGTFPSDYARNTVGARTNNYGEDFAESFDRYVRAQNGGTMDSFRQQFPGRSSILDQVMREEAGVR